MNNHTTQSCGILKQLNSGNGRSTSEYKTKNEKEDCMCYYCGIKGHLKSDCHHYKCAQQDRNKVKKKYNQDNKDNKDKDKKD